MKAHALNAALDRGREAALEQEAKLAEQYRIALTQIGGMAARQFVEVTNASLTAAAPSAQSAMVAVYPTSEQADALAQPNGEPAEIIHVTLAFLGELDADQAEAAAAVVRQVAATFEYDQQDGGIEGTVGGIAAFGSETGFLAEIARIAGLVKPDGGYGQTLWNRETATVLWIPADWTTEQEQEAAAQAFLTVPTVEAVEIAEAESATPAGDEWELLWNGQALVEASYPSIILPDVPGLAELRHAVCEALSEAGIPYAENHGWTPHGTLDYTPEPTPPPETLLGLPLTFENLSFTQGDVARDFPLGQEAALLAAGPPDWNPPHEDEIIDAETIVGRLHTKADPIRAKAVKATALPALDEARISWDVTNPFVDAVLEKTGAEIVGIAETTRLNVMRLVREGYEQGLSIDDTAKAIREGMADAAGSRATMIARTEMQSLVNGGAVAATQIVAQETGIQYFARWLTAPGAENPRHEDYEGLDGQTVPLGGLFDVGGAKLEYPGDPAGPPDESINCRCALIFIEQADLAQEVDIVADLAETTDELAAIELGPIVGDDIASLASSVIARAKASEPKLTEIMKKVVEPRGGVLEGLPFRLKSEASMERKIKLVSDQARIPELAAANATRDSVRYTAVFGPSDFATKTTSTLNALKAAGVIPERVSSVWKAGSPYVGTNVVLKAPNGIRFELQFHTPESLATKQALNHGLYEQWRKLDPGAPEAKALEQRMVANADRVLRPKGITTWKYDPSVEAEVGVTPFRAGDDPIGFYDSDKFKRFEADVKTAAKQYGVEVERQGKVAGIWEGEEEPAVALRIHDGELGVRAFAAELGKAYDQDGVLLFTAKNGEDVIATFGATQSAREEVFAAMADVGLPAGRFLEDGRLQVIGSGPEFVGQLDRLAANLNTGYDADVGEFLLLEKTNGDYEAAIKNFGGAQGEQVRAAKRGAKAGDRGPAAVGPSAPGREAGAPQVSAAPDALAAKTLPQPAVPVVPEPLTPAQVKRLSVDDLWSQYADLGKIENLARAEVADASQAPFIDDLWKRGEGRLPKGAVRYTDITGDQQIHSLYSDGHQRIDQMAEEARARGQRQIVVSDHSHLLTEADIRLQHAEIDLLNEGYQKRNVDFRILKGIEVNILPDGTLDTATDILSQFDVVNASINAPVQGEQLALFAKTNTERLVQAMENPQVKVIVHPHSVDADWDAVAKAAAKKDVALEVNGRDLLRNDRQDAAAAMIAAAKKHGAKLAFGSDAHTSGDLVDVVYAIRFAGKHGVTIEDVVVSQRLRFDPSTTLPGDGEIALGRIGSRRLGGGVNIVWKVERGDQSLIVKPEPDLSKMAADHGVGTGSLYMRENITPGADLERERAAYIVSRYFNEEGAGQFKVNVPAYRISEIIQPGALGRAKVRAGIAEFIEGDTAADSGIALQDWIGGLGRERFIDVEGFNPTEETRSAALFDAVIGNTDRHGGNWIYGDDGHLWLIDHGLAFPEFDTGQFSNERIVEFAAYRFKVNLLTRERDFLERLLARWPELKSDLLGAGLDPVAVTEMKTRIQFMLDENSRRPWPSSADLGY